MYCFYYTFLSLKKQKTKNLITYQITKRKEEKYALTNMTSENPINMSIGLSGITPYNVLFTSRQATNYSRAPIKLYGDAQYNKSLLFPLLSDVI